MISLPDRKANEALLGTANYQRDPSLIALGPENTAKVEAMAAGVLASTLAADPVTALADALERCGDVD